MFTLCCSAFKWKLFLEQFWNDRFFYPQHFPGLLATRESKVVMVTKLSRHSYQQLQLQLLLEQNFNDPGLIDLEMICNLDLADLVLSCNASGSMTLTFVRCYSNSRFHGSASIIAKILFCIVKDFYLWNKTACYVTQKKPASSDICCY